MFSLHSPSKDFSLREADKGVIVEIKGVAMALRLGHLLVLSNILAMQPRRPLENVVDDGGT